MPVRATAPRQQDHANLQGNFDHTVGQVGKPRRRTREGRRALNGPVFKFYKLKQSALLARARVH